MPTSTFQTSADLAKKTFEQLAAWAKNKNSHIGFNTGYGVLNNALRCTRQNNDLLVISGLNAEYFSSLAINIALNAAKGTEIHPQLASAIFLLGTSEIDFGKKMLSALGKVSLASIHSNHLSDYDWDGLIEAADALTKSTIVIDATLKMSLDDLLLKAAAMKARYGIKLMAIDDARLLAQEKGTGSKLFETLKNMANALEVSIIAGFSTYYKHFEKPSDFLCPGNFSDYADLARYSDILMLLHSNQDDGTAKLTPVTISILKNHCASPLQLEMMFLREYGLFEEITKAPFADALKGWED